MVNREPHCCSRQVGQDRSHVLPQQCSDHLVHATGSLRVQSAIPRYFTDGSGKAICLTGSHTWNNLVDMGPTNPPSALNFDAHLDFLDKHHHNYIRLWRFELFQWKRWEGNGELVKYGAPHA